MCGFSVRTSGFLLVLKSLCAALWLQEIEAFMEVHVCSKCTTLQTNQDEPVSRNVVINSTQSLCCRKKLINKISLGCIVLAR